MITPEQCMAKYGNPDNPKNMVMWDLPTKLEIGVIPKKLYVNAAMIEPLTAAFTNLIERGFVDELKTFDGCYCKRLMRGTKNTWSIHTWALAIDVNAAWNALKAKPTLSKGFVQCFTDAGFDWGGNWKRLDGMHFQLSKI
jgi:D-alanyl-D-alanine carboxypeptidase